MMVRRTGLVMSMAIALSLAAGASAFAMQPVVSKDGLTAGAEVGYNFGSFPGNFSAAGDVEYGLKTNFLKQTYTGIVLDDLSVFGSGAKISLTTLGVQQPFSVTGTTSIAGEAGFARTSVYIRGLGNASSNGGFVGVRGTLAQSGDLTLNLMGRYLFGGANDTFWQLGVGVTKPLSNGLVAQADYYRIHPNTAGASDDNFILIGARFTLGS